MFAIRIARDRPNSFHVDTHIRRRATKMLRAKLAGALLSALLLNLHYVLLGRPLLEGLLTSRPVLALGNGLFGKVVRRNMIKA